MVISLTGGGGKTTTMNYIANYYKNTGKKVIITTTTHILKPEKYFEIKKADDLFSLSQESGIIVIGRDCKKKLASIDLKEVERLDKFADVVLVEADGAKMLPIKVPDEYEPVIPENSDICIVCMGMDAISKTVGEICFRKELAKKVFGFEENHIISCKDAARILTHKDGGLKGVSERRTVFLLNKADSQEDVEKAFAIERYIKVFCEEMNFHNYKVSITSYKNNKGFKDFDFLERI